MQHRNRDKLLKPVEPTSYLIGLCCLSVLEVASFLGKGRFLKKVLFALVIQFMGSLSFAIEAFPILMPRPSAEGAKVIDFRIDTENLYLRTSNSEIIRVDKLALINGDVVSGVISREQWASIKEPAPELVALNHDGYLSVWGLGKQIIRVKHAYCGEGQDKWHALQIRIGNPSA